jgi:hypothetical protein
MPRSKLATVNAILVLMARRWRRGSLSTLAPGRKWDAYSGYTITSLVEELAERAEQRVTARLPSRPITMPNTSVMV